MGHGSGARGVDQAGDGRGERGRRRKEGKTRTCEELSGHKQYTENRGADMDGQLPRNS